MTLKKIILSKLLKLKIILTYILVANFNLHAQLCNDTILTDSYDTIACKITYVNNYTVFYNILENNKINNKVLPRIDIEKLVINSINITVLEQKFDSHINGFYKKSKLDNKYQTLLLKDNSNNQIRILADSTFIFKKNDYFGIAMNVEQFAKKYRCKLIYISNLIQENSIKFNVKLYDAKDSYYKEISNSYRNNSIFFFRGKNSMEPDEIKLKHSDSIYWLKKNEILEFKIDPKDLTQNLPDSTLKNGICQTKYYYVGDISNYKLNASIFASLFASVAISAIAGPGFVLINFQKNVTVTSNFIGEFIIILTKTQ